jgi:hypothetical protein
MKILDSRPSPSSLRDVTLRCFGVKVGTALLERGAVHPINDRRNRKACYIRGVHNGFFDIDTIDYLALGFQAGQLSGIQVLDIDSRDYDLGDVDVNVHTARGAHIYSRWQGGRNRISLAPQVDLIANGNVVFWDEQTKDFRHPGLARASTIDGLLVSLQEQAKQGE